MTTSGIEEVGRDLSQTEVAVYSLVDGSWRRFEGIGTSDGSYEVEFDGPVERLVLQVGDRYRQIEEVSAEDTYLFATATARRADAALFAELFASIPAIDGQFLEPSAWLYGLIPGRVTEPSVVSIGAPAIFPSEWLWWEAGMQTSEEVALEGTGPTSVYGGLFVRWRASAGLPDGFVPARVPSISLDGVDISELTSVAHTPTVTISGESAFRYEVEVVRVFRDSQDESLSTSTVIATITSRGSQISVPPGVLEPGERYVLMVRTAEAPAAGVEQTTTSFSPLLSVTP